MMLAKYNSRRLVIYSGDEMKQCEMAKLYGDDERLENIALAMSGYERIKLPYANIKQNAQLKRIMWMQACLNISEYQSIRKVCKK
jgi:hypothetical protein